MRIVIGTDEARPVVTFLKACLLARGHVVTEVPTAAWGRVATEVAQAVARGEAEQGIVCCWTGTGVSIAANKVPGVRAALCVDATTAAGARRWNDANVLALSLRLLSEPVGEEIVEAWLGATYEGGEGESLALLAGEGATGRGEGGNAPRA